MNTYRTVITQTTIYNLVNPTCLNSPNPRLSYKWKSKHTKQKSTCSTKAPFTLQSKTSNA